MNVSGMNFGNMNADDDNNLDARIRSALTAEADMVNPAGDGLDRIRAGVDESGGRVWWRNPAVAIAAAAVLGLAVAAASFALYDDGTGEIVTSTPTTSATTASASPEPSPTPTPTATPSETSSATEEPVKGPVNLAIYYVRDDGTGIRLYREYHSVSLVGGDRIRSALIEMFVGDAKDPDYTSLWPRDAKVNRVTKQGDTAQIDLNRAVTKANVGARAAEATLQQLVYTVTAADTSVKKVKLTVDGRQVAQLWGHVAVGSRALTRAPAVDVVGLIWLLAPREGDKVGRTVQIKGVGTAFEGTISWEVLNAGGKVVAKGSTQGGANGEFAGFTDQVTLRPGTYTIRAFESSAEDGRALHVDDKRFAVQ